ncbi:pyrroline-5-carboxylate reductase [Methylonatrum kenyense]|uniref:pyrroline-5-carboxylate reductase n=1 Tax=Methylonatrum kenyense TaxID=455253 RepID=UPI0020BDEA60|nr:pyrroline-5-carboxylate reductase [Methylonatrum kenyense]MCK8516649.1 pyrroline-5-carboxylate reductase [Methylonatrum kenyense]
MEQAEISFIGGGNMARSLIGGLLADGLGADAIRVAEPDAGRRQALGADFGITTVEDNMQAAQNADVVVLAVKPQVMRQVADELAHTIGDGSILVLSIAAGLRAQDLTRWLGPDAAVVRAMPNTPSLVRAGATGLFANANVSDSQRSLAESLMRAVGLTCWVDNEQQLDAVTAVSGSGPAYFFLLMEMIESAGIELGLEPETARLLTIETAIGAARMALESDHDPQTLRRLVTSPGGTTEAAINSLEDADIRALLKRAVTAAANRADELGQQFGEQ